VACLPIRVSQVAGVLLFAAGAMTALLAAGRRPATVLLAGYALAAALPLLSAFAMTLWCGDEVDWPLLAAPAVAPAPGSVVGSALISIRGAVA
jgi:hypothetical protein